MNCVPIEQININIFKLFNYINADRTGPCLKLDQLDF
jgi:hypothetical protein